MGDEPSLSFLALAALPATARAQAQPYGDRGHAGQDRDRCRLHRERRRPGLWRLRLELGRHRCRGRPPFSCGAVPEALPELILDDGSGPGGEHAPIAGWNRIQEGDRLDYDLFQDAGRTIHWGDRSGRDTLEVQTTGSQQSIPIYGQIPAGQRALEGTYSDTITIRVIY